jgi:tetratricopeptide (TPR) repeat protein
MLETLRQVQTEDPVPPSQLHPRLARDLETICLKCLHKDPHRRYATVAELAEDLRRFLDGEPIVARPVGRVERLWRWCRRNPTAAVAAALLLTATVALGIGLAVVDQARQETQGALNRVELEQEKTARALEQSRQAEKSAAEQRRLALRTIREVVVDIHLWLKRRPGPAAQQLRKAVLLRALAGLTEVARTADTVTAIDHQTVWFHFELGDLFFLIEEEGSEEAKDWYEKAHGLAVRVQQANPGSTQAEHDLAVAHNKLGDICLRLGESQAARDWYRKGLEVRQRLADAHKGDAETQRDLFVSWSKLGDVSLGLGENQQARDYHEKALKVCQGLIDAGPTIPEDHRNLSVAYNKLGDAWLRLTDTKRALDCYERCHAILKRLAEADRGSALAQRDLSISHERLGDLHLRRRESQAALDYYRKALELRRRLADADPTSAQTQRDLAVAHGKVGEAWLQRGDAKEALGHFQKDLEICQRLADSDPTNVKARTDVFVACWHLGRAEKERFEYAKAADWFGRAAAGLRPLHQAGKLAVPYQSAVPRADLEAAICRGAAQAVADPATAAVLSDELREPVLTAAMFALARKEKQPAKAVVAADLLAGNARGPNGLYDAACGYALCVPLADQPRKKEEYAACAVGMLRRAVAKGYKDLANMKKDTDLDALRGRDEFQKLLAELEAVIRRQGGKPPEPRGK